MRIVHSAKSFRREYAKLARSGWKLSKLDRVMDHLIEGKILPTMHRDHALQGDWKGIRDCHIEGDWLLLYELGTDADGNEFVLFHATGTHEHLFG